MAKVGNNRGPRGGELTWSLTSTWTNPSLYGTATYFHLKIHDAQGVPGNIDYVKAHFPDGTTEISLYPDYNETPTCAVYRGAYFGTVQPGDYEITVMDKDGNSDTKTETLTSSPINPPAETSLLHANNAVIGSTGVSFDWDDVSGKAFYQVDLYDKDFNNLYYIKTTSPSYTFPPGVLKENSLYRYRIITMRDFFEDNLDNGASAPSGMTIKANTFFTTAKTGTDAAPTLDISNYGVAVWQGPHPVTGLPYYYLEFFAMVTDSDGVPENIKSVEVAYPDGVTKLLLKYNDIPDWGSNYYNNEIYTDASSIQSGVYTFKVKDFEDHEVTVTDTLTNVATNVLPWPTNVAPADGAKLPGTTPTITWDPVSGASLLQGKNHECLGIPNHPLEWRTDREQLYGSGGRPRSQHHV